MHYLFFDVDGTLLPFGKKLPASTGEALKLAKEKGNKIFLATGRSMAELDDEMRAIPFDGYVASAGCKAYVEGQEIFSSLFSEDDLKTLFAITDEQGWPLLLQCEEASCYTGNFYDILSDYFVRYVKGKISIQNLMQVDAFKPSMKALKALLLAPSGNMKEARRILSPYFEVVDNTVGVPQTHMCEVCQKGVTKLTGLEAVLKHYGATLDEAIAFGDGANDIEMVSSSGIGVAMGNADVALKKVASYIADECDRDGIYKTLKHFGVI